jgi:hypothetical protein
MARPRGRRQRRFQKTVKLTPLTATFFGRRPNIGSLQRLCREPRARVLGKDSWPRKNFSWALCRARLSAKALPKVWWDSRQSLDFQVVLEQLQNACTSAVSIILVVSLGEGV